MCDEAMSDRPTLRTIRFRSDLKVGGNLAVGGLTAINHENAQQGKALCPTGGLPPKGGRTKSELDFQGNVAAKSVHVDVQNSFNVSYAGNGGGETNLEGAEFYRRIMRDGEHPLDFATELKVLAVQYAIPENELLNQFVHGLIDEDMKRKLRIKHNLTMDRAIGLVEAWLDDT